MIVEIGTSDFRTAAGIRDGLFIEPVKPYFDRLPKCRKEKVAISNYEGDVDIYYMNPEDIEKLKLPNWLRGCNMIGKQHPTMVDVLQREYGTTDPIKKETVKVVRIKTLLDKYNINNINLLKIDTEGHDCTILNDFFDTVNFLPIKIIFENNVLSKKVEIESTVSRLNSLGYNLQYGKGDIICNL